MWLLYMVYKDFVKALNLFLQSRSRKLVKDAFDGIENWLKCYKRILSMRFGIEKTRY